MISYYSCKDIRFRDHSWLFIPCIQNRGYVLDAITVFNIKGSRGDLRNSFSKESCLLVIFSLKRRPTFFLLLHLSHYKFDPQVLLMLLALLTFVPFNQRVLLSHSLSHSNQVKDETIVRLTNQMHELELSSAALASSAASGGTVTLSATSGSSDGYSPKMTSNGIR